MSDLVKIVEAFLFVAGGPVTVDRICKVLKESTSLEVKQAIASLKDRYDNSHGMKIVEVAGGYQMVTDSEIAAQVKRFVQRSPQRLSRQCMETLSIVAYKQPITRNEVEQIRGVNADGPIQTLLDKGMIKMLGRKEVLGRPFLYGTTQAFLERFGLTSIKDLPPLEEMIKAEQEREEEAEIEAETEEAVVTTEETNDAS